ncbi:MAG TPA: NAD(+) synthase [Thermoanaerobaculia bacterium]|nr:NAD(+) synthase [Thermoanaerobaculia bacterium]
MSRGRRDGGAPPFDSIYRHGFLRVAVGVPAARVADPAANLAATLELVRRAAERHAALALFPELGLSTYAIDDLHQQDALLDAVEAAVGELVAASRELAPLIVAGAPLRSESKLFNCAVVVHRGRLLGVAVKTFLPNYREYYERRQFASAREAVRGTIRLAGCEVPFGNDLLFEAEDVPDLALHVEICEDLWVPVPPSTWAALAGATVLANLSASNVTIGKADYRRALVGGQSAKCVAAYLYSAAGPGESTTDLAWDGHALIYENGERLAESLRFPEDPPLVTADVDLERLRQDRMRMTSFGECVGEHAERARRLRRVPFRLEPPTGSVPLDRAVDRFPYVPADQATRDERCYEAYNIQVHGLEQRLRATGVRKVVLGVSGGLDSTQALIVAAKTFDRLGLPRDGILGYSMPGFATSARTRANALALMQALGVTATEIDIRPSARQMLADLDHPAARGEPVYDVTFENVQAGERTSHLFRLANRHDALVVGTGDLSELALGWTTYGVGDHMSHYNVNASVPKTLVRYLIAWEIASGRLDEEASRVLRSILDTAISPELVPGDEGGESAADEGPHQSTEEKVGPFELQDFHLYFVTRYGFRPSKVAFLAHHAWSDRARGRWPPGFPDEKKNEYDLAAIRRWLEIFLHRFFELSQFKRSAAPNGPKVGSGGSLSPRGDWRAPSDASSRAWVDELRANVPEG